MTQAKSLTPRELEIAGLVWQCFKSEPQIDFHKFAELAGWKNANSANACWGPIKKKLINAAASGISSPSKEKINTMMPKETEDLPKKRSTKIKSPKKASSADASADAPATTFARPETPAPALKRKREPSVSYSPTGYDDEDPFASALGFDEGDFDMGISPSPTKKSTATLRPRGSTTRGVAIMKKKPRYATKPNKEQQNDVGEPEATDDDE